MIKRWPKITWMVLVVMGILGALMLIPSRISLVQASSVQASSVQASSVQASSVQASSVQELIRYPIPNSNFPIARAVELPANAKLVYVSGQVPPVVNEDVPRTTIEAFGDTATQTVGVLERIQSALNDMDLTMGDVVKMQAFLVGDPSNEGRMDFAGFMDGYTQFFGTQQQPNLPARSVMQVAGLVNPGWLVEIEVVAVRSE